MSDYKSAFRASPLGEYFENSPEGITFPLYKKVSLGENPFKGNHHFTNTPYTNFTSEFYYGKTDYRALAEDLIRNFKGRKFIFGAKKYLKTLPEIVKNIPQKVEGTDVVKKNAYFTESIPFQYKKQGFQQDAVFSRAYLNSKVCELERDFSIIAKVKPKSSRADSYTFFSISFYYKGTKQFRDITDFSEEGKKFKIHDKYKAIELHTTDANVFYQFATKINPREAGSYERYLAERFSTAFQSSNLKNPEVLNWFYEQTPVFILQKRKIAKLWEHLTTLLKFDQDKWFIDSSNAMIKAMKAIIAKTDGIAYLYDQFYANPKLVKQIYTFLDESNKSVIHGGILIPNKTVFASLITQICLANRYNKNSNHHSLTEESETLTFQINEKYRVDSNAYADDTYSDKFDLRQQAYETVERSFYSTAVGMTSRSKNDEWVYLDETKHAHPLQMVLLVLKDENGNDFTTKVPAIFVKDLAYHREWGEIMEIIQIGIDILAIVLGIAGILSGNPFLIALGVMDISIAGFDLYVQVMKDEYMKTPEGRLFLRNWQYIYVNFGLATAVISFPSFVRGTLSLGLSLYKGATGATKDFLRIIIFKIILESNIQGFTGNTLKAIDIGSDIFKNSKIAFDIGKTTRLQDAGVSFVGGIYKGSNDIDEVLVLYKNEIILQGTVKDVRDALKPIAKFEGKKLVSALDDIFTVVVRKNIFEKWADKFIKKFHLHFDGEFIIKSKKGIKYLRGSGGHNHEVLGNNIIIRKYLNIPKKDSPFEALISVRYKNGQWIEKKAKSSFFPKNWDISRVKQEITLIYDKMIKENHKLEFSVNKYISTGNSNFGVVIEVDNFGNLLNAYPKIN